MSGAETPAERGARALAGYVEHRVLPDSEPVEAYITECYIEARGLVDDYCRGSKVPRWAKHRCYMEVGNELYSRRGKPSGIYGSAAEPGAVDVRLARDPMMPVYPMLARWVVPL